MALEAWQRREVLKEWSERRRAHVNAIISNSNYGGDELGQALQEIDRRYDQIIAEAQMTAAERQAIDDEADTAFMRAGRRAAARSVEWAGQDPVLPGEETIRRLPS